MAYFKARVGGSSGNEPVLLWTNPNPTSAFTTPTLNIDLTDYKWILIRAYNRTDNTSAQFSFDTIIKKEVGQLRMTCIGRNKGGGQIDPLYREFTINQNGLVFGRHAGNGYFNVPYEIYGYKNDLISV